jgi:serpin B
MKKFLVIFAALLCLFLSVSNADAAPAPSGKAVTDGINAFACDLYGQLRSQQGNLFFSPLSITYALAAAGAGAGGETLAQMERALHAPMRGEQARQAFAGLLQGVNAEQRGGQLQIEIANSLWPAKKFSLLPAYVETAQKHFDAAVMPVDYAKDSRAVASRINAWVEEKTRGRIRNFMTMPPAPDTRLTLINTVYFKGSWVSPFKAKKTREDVFHAPGKAVRVPFMSQKNRFRYLELKDLQVLALPYGDGRFSLIALLPARTPGALENLENELSPHKLVQWTGALAWREVKVFLPKFTLSWGPASLKGTLDSLGMGNAFSPDSADFSGMSLEKPGLLIGDVLHQANIDVDEQGTVAAAATGAPIAAAASLPSKAVPEFRADRPFVFLIRDNVVGTILFMGRLMDPVWNRHELLHKYK